MCINDFYKICVLMTSINMCINDFYKIWILMTSIKYVY